MCILDVLELGLLVGHLVFGGKNMLNWQLKAFKQLSLTELYAIIQLREQIFVVEQQAIYLDADGADLTALHLMLWESEQLVAYARILAPDAAGVVHFGRVCVRNEARKNSIGRQLVLKILAEIQLRYADAVVIISAQKYLQEFYQALGFTVISADYLTEDGILHVDMRLA